jgi:3-phosphoshikimate 1-carboxyvinyltransferase
MKQQDPSSEPLLRISRSPALRGKVSVPGDKSISHRALLFGALADGAVEISGLGLGGDNASTMAALRALGVPIRQTGTDARVEGVGLAGLHEASGSLDCGNSGTTMRLFCGLLAGRPFVSTLIGDESLSRRPMARVATPLRRMGAVIDGRQETTRPSRVGSPPAFGTDSPSCPPRALSRAPSPAAYHRARPSEASGAGWQVGGRGAWKPSEGSHINDLFPPLTVRGGALQGIEYELPVASAQIKSALILAGLQARGRTVISEPGLSRDHSERMLRFIGAPVSAEPEQRRVVVDPTGWNGRLRAGPVTVPGDLSSAAFLLVAALIVPDSDVTVDNVGLNPTRTGVLDALLAMGADLEIKVTGEAMGEPLGSVRARWSERGLHGIAVAGELALRSIDEIPALAVAAVMADGTTEFGDLRELRVKESDRIACIARELQRAGVTVREARDGFCVMGTGRRPCQGGRVQPDGDHRIAMAGAILGLVAADATEVPSQDIATSFPSFARLLQELGAMVG